MPIRRIHTYTALRAATLALALLLCTAHPAAAERYTIINSPPPLPKTLMPPAEVDEPVKMEPPVTPPPGSYSVLPTGPAQSTRIGGKTVAVHEFLADDAGFAVPDMAGGLVLVPAPVPAAPPGLANARELKLHVRELAAQLIADIDPSLRGMVAMPTSFVNQENFSQSSALGRFMAEQLIYEFNQRGFPVREYRMATAIRTREGEGEFLLSRKIAPIPVSTRNALFVVGTYFIDRQAVFINARLVRGNGTVLRTAQIILPSSAITRRMLAGSGATLKKGSLPIQDFKTTTQPTNLTPIDLGADVH